MGPKKDKGGKGGGDKGGKGGDKGGKGRDKINLMTRGQVIKKYLLIMILLEYFSIIW